MGGNQMWEGAMRLFIYSLMVVLALLTGCTTAKPIYTADGKQGHSIICSGTANSWAGCYEKAGELCGEKGYTVQDKSGDTGFVASASTTNAFAGSTISRSMIVQGKEK